ncbi:Ubiquitin carboxyl-terminal hydrolase 39-like protein [Drosera capensis]
MEAESLIRRREDEEEGIDGDEKDSKRQRVEEGASSQVLEFENPLLTLSKYDDEDEDENGGRVVEGEKGGGKDDGVNGRGGEVENVNERIVDEENGHGGGLGDGANGHGGVVENDDEGGGENGEEEEEVMAGGGGGVVDEEEEEEEGGGGAERVGGRHIRHVEVRRDCPYLDTVNRQVLDFDFEKFCSVSLSNLNVYACLVCGKYFQGRGHKSHAYTHSLEAGHHVYINLRKEKVYCLPDGYEINDPSLDDIHHVLNPRFNREQVEQIDKNKLWSRALDGSDYLPGMVGLNNIKDTDFVNVTIQSLMRVTPLRNFFLIPENYQHCKSPLVHRFGELTRKIWHARNFKGQVSPHEFLQAVMKASKKRFRIGAQSDPVEFMSWLLNTLHADIRTKKNYSVIYQCFQGELEVVKEIQRKALPAKEENGEDIDAESEKGNIIREASKMPFLMLGLDLPPPPLFKDVMEKNIIPQVQLFNIFKKFDGETVTEVMRPHIARMRYRVTRLPPYLILHMRRFTKNNFFMEKNPTLVNFPAKNLELKDYIPLPTPKGNEKLRSKYDLIANIVHDGKPGEGSYRAFVQRKSEEQWYEMQDLHVSETLPQMVALSEAYMQIYEQQQ